RLVSGEGLRSRLRRAAIKARDPEIGAGSARRAHSLRQDQGRREGEDLRRSRRARLQRRDGGGGLTKNSPPSCWGGRELSEIRVRGSSAEVRAKRASKDDSPGPRPSRAASRPPQGDGPITAAAAAAARAPPH